MSDLLLLHAADLHLDSPFESLSSADGDHRRDAQRQRLRALAELAEKRGVHAVLLSGDVFDCSRVSDKTLEVLYQSLGAVKCPVIISPGNHDFYSPSSIWERMALPSNIHIFKNPEIECLELFGVPARFWGAGFQSENSPALLSGFKAPEKKAGKADIMVLHGELGAAGSAYNPISRQELSDCGMDYVALGHTHTRNPLCLAGNTTYAWPGCIEGRGFDETGVCGVYLINVSDRGVGAEFIPLEGTRYHIIGVDISGGNAFEAIFSSTKQIAESDHCRLVLTGECEQLPNLAALHQKLDGRFKELQLRDETRKKQDIWAFVSQDSLAGVFTASLKARHSGSTNSRERKKIELAAQYGLAALTNGGESL